MSIGLNLGHSIFKGFNDKNGIMICGYEWGFSKKDQKLFENGNVPEFNQSAITTFSNKSPAHGARAFSWPYDNRILRWFEIWGHALSRQGLGSNFDKCIVQTNWCNTEGHNIKGNYYEKLTKDDQVANFIYHIKELEPSLIFFMGSSMIDILQIKHILNQFEDIMGSRRSVPEKIQKDFQGRRFKVGFQSFGKCEIVSLPHPSGSVGISDEYIALFKPNIAPLIAEFKRKKEI